MIAHKIRLDLTEAQVRLFNRWAEASRQAWNWAVSEWQRQYRDCVGGQRFKRVGRDRLVPVGDPWTPDPVQSKPSAASLSRLLTRVRRHAPPGTLKWMRPPVPARVYRQPIRDLAAAWSAFQRRLAAGQKLRHPSNPFGGPVPKRSDAPRTFYLSGQDVDIAAGHIELPFGHRFRMREAPRFRGRVVGATFSEKAGSWSVALTMEFDRKRQPPPADTHAGVGLGVGTLATVGTRTAPVSPDGAGAGSVLLQTDAPPTYATALRRLRRLSKDVSRKMQGSHNRRKAIARLRKHHARLVNLRRDVLHKLTTEIVRRAANVGVENLAAVLDGDGTSRAIAAMGIYEFRRQLEYKAAETGVEIAVADRSFPSSRRCGACGEPNRIPENQWRRVHRWTCDCCGTEHDRDVNAAFNLDPGSLDAGASGPELPVQ